MRNGKSRAKKILGERVPVYCRAGDIVYGMVSTAFSSEVLIRTVRPKFSSAVT